LATMGMPQLAGLRRRRRVSSQSRGQQRTDKSKLESRHANGSEALEAWV
jgi:hypothetical protein